MKRATLIALSVFSLNAFAGFGLPSVPKMGSSEVNVKDATLQAGLEVCSDKLANDPNHAVTVMAMNEAIKALADDNEGMAYKTTVSQLKGAAQSFDTEKCKELSLGL